jgi:hypothetical protein
MCVAKLRQGRGVTKDGEAVDPLQRQYGTVSNEEFFTTFKGDY